MSFLSIPRPENRISFEMRDYIDDGLSHQCSKDAVHSRFPIDTDMTFLEFKHTVDTPEDISFMLKDFKYFNFL